MNDREPTDQRCVAIVHAKLMKNNRPANVSRARIGRPRSRNVGCEGSGLGAHKGGVSGGGERPSTRTANDGTAGGKTLIRNGGEDQREEPEVWKGKPKEKSESYRHPAPVSKPCTGENVLKEVRRGAPG